MVAAFLILVGLFALIAWTAPTPVTVGPSFPALPNNGANGAVPFGMTKESTKTTAYTVLAADNGTLFHSNGSGSLTFTLPVCAAGLAFVFHNIANQNMVISQGSDSAPIITDGHATGATVTFSTASHLVGATYLIRANAAGTAWEGYNLSAGPTATMA
jgi:hypothetical protein